MIGNHFNSKGGDDPTFGRFQEPRRSSEVQRHGQADVLNAFVKKILAIDPRSRVVALGDLNDFEFSETVHVLEQAPTRRAWSWSTSGTSSRRTSTTATSSRATARCWTTSSSARRC